jgi:hypothetical protein
MRWQVLSAILGHQVCRSRPLVQIKCCGAVRTFDASSVVAASLPTRCLHGTCWLQLDPDQPASHVGVPSRFGLNLVQPVVHPASQRIPGHYFAPPLERPASTCTRTASAACTMWRAVCCTCCMQDDKTSDEGSPNTTDQPTITLDDGIDVQDQIPAHMPAMPALPVSLKMKDLPKYHLAAHTADQSSKKRTFVPFDAETANRNEV